MLSLDLGTEKAVWTTDLMSDTSAESHTMRKKKLLVAENGLRSDLEDGRTIVSIGEQIHFDLSALGSFDVEGSGPLHYDVLVLCAAIEFADKHWARSVNWSRHFEIAIPVTSPDAWQDCNVRESLKDALEYLTGDIWNISFFKAEKPALLGSAQLGLPFINKKTYAIAYSEGLDSRTVSGLSGEDEEALRIRVLSTRQERQAGEERFTRIPFSVRDHGSRESSFRSRGFQFAAITSLAAQLCSIRRVVVPESGQGALGPALAPIYRIYEDYRNHPTFFRRMERFIKALLNYDVEFEQPRLWYTKGQTVRAFLALPAGSLEALRNTRSCWQSRRVVNVGRRKQCGLCAACLLRRFSLQAAGVSEAADAYVVSNLTTPDIRIALESVRKEDRNLMLQYGHAGARHFQRLADLAFQPDATLRPHASQIAASRSESQSGVLESLRAMLISHAEEWSAFVYAQGKQSFLCSWMDRGRYSGST